MAHLFKKNIAFLVLFTAFCLSIKAQDVNSLIMNYGDKYSPERVHIHYDKSSYAVGETIWYKVYMMNALVPAEETKNIYVDFIDDKGMPLLHATAPVVEGVTNGQFDIPADYKGKLIHVRAYSRWMLNFDTAFFYNKDIRIISKNESSPVAKLTVIPTLNFFPEGGDAIVGIKNKIAFKANDQWGRPVKISGVILNSKGKVTDSIKVMHDGMGYFYLTPETGLNYSAKWKDEKGVEHTTALPSMKEMGASLEVTVAGTTRSFFVDLSPAVAATMDSMHIVGTMYQHPVFNIAKSTAGVIKGIVPTQNLPTGILTITLFDNHWNAIAERITYVKNDDYFFTPQMEVQHWGLSKRAKNELKISVPDSIVSSLSIAVTDIGIGGDSSSNIISDLLLSSELKGDIYNPAYYFSDNNDNVDQNLDLVMLTHGWRRFNWDEVLKNKPVKFLYARDTAYMTLSGTVAGASLIAPDATVVLMIKQKDKAGQISLVPVNSNGTFNDATTILFDTATVYYQFQKKEMKSASAQFMTNRLAMYPVKGLKNGIGFWSDTTGNYRQWHMADAANEFANKEKVKTLDAVVIKSKGKSPVQLLDEKYSSGLFSGGDSYQFDMMNDPFAKSAQDIFSYLQGKVAGLQISTAGNIGDGPSISWRGGTPQIYLDEAPVDAAFVSTMNVNDIAYVKVLRPPFFGGGGNGANGAIAIYTRKGGDVKSEPGKGLANNKVYGYTPIRQFYSPNYDKFNPENANTDIRSTLYWNPAVQLSPQQPSTVVSFFNNDVSKAFKVVIEGMTKDGRLAHIEQTME